MGEIGNFQPTSRRILRTLGQRDIRPKLLHVAYFVLQALMKAVDASGDGKIDKQEFFKFFGSA